MKDEALKLALEALETELAVDMTNGAEVGEAAELMCEAITAIKQALAAPVQEPVENKWRTLALQFDVHRMSALVHLRAMVQDPAKHADVAREFLSAPPPAAQPAVPDAIHHTDLSEHPQYIQGWNDCRQAMMEMMK